MELFLQCPGGGHRWPGILSTISNDLHNIKEHKVFSFLFLLFVCFVLFCFFRTSQETQGAKVALLRFKSF